MGQTETRPEVIVAALLYLITAYRRTRCPGLAACIARHFQHLAAHPRADRVICEIAAASKLEWEIASRELPPPAAKPGSAFGLALH